VLVEDEILLLVDCGLGTLFRLGQTGIDVNDLDAVLITHHHIDHMGDLLGLLKARWLEGGDSLSVYAPPDVGDIIFKIIEIYPYLKENVKVKVITDPVAKIGDIFMKSIPTIHSVECRAYILESKDWKVVFSGDTEPFKELLERAEGNILIHECSFPPRFKVSNHTTPDNLLQYIRLHRPSSLVLTHLYPQAMEWRDEIQKMLSGSVDLLIFAEDLKSFEV
jgi:ribonuclease BN (tRNA processing enzyme)